MADYNSTQQMMGKQHLQVAVGILLAQDKSILLTQRQSHQLYADFWEFPGGKIESSETPTMGLTRELHEELGIEVTDMYPLVCVQHTYPEYSVHLHVFIVKAFENNPKSMEGQKMAWCAYPELSQYKLLPANDIILQALKDTRQL